MRAPEFWRAGGILPAVLQPFARVFATAGALRYIWITPWRAPVPVICIGNLVAGGAGKTPVALAVAARLKALGRDAHFLSRGHGGTHPGPLRVEAAAHSARIVGDEALLLAAEAPSWIARDRAEGARAASAEGAEIIIMDDGFQNPGLTKDLSFLVFDGGYGVGNGRVLPAGPMRESFAGGLARADAAVILGPDRCGIASALAENPGRDIPILQASLRPGPEAAALAGRRVIAFAGIARPEKFFTTLREIGCELVAEHGFPDHVGASIPDLWRMNEEAKIASAQLVTTAKDAVRLPNMAQSMVETLTVTVEWADEAALDRLLAPLIENDRPTNGLR